MRRTGDGETGVIATQLAVLMPALLLMLAVQFACGPGTPCGSSSTCHNTGNTEVAQPNEQAAIIP